MVSDLPNWDGRGDSQTASATDGGSTASLPVDPTRNENVNKALRADDGNAVNESAGVDFAPVESAARETSVAGDSDGTSSSDTDVDVTVVIMSGKEYAPPASVGEISCDDYALLGEAPWWDLEALESEDCVDRYTEDECLHGGILIE